MQKVKLLNGNTLKIIATVAMLIDHIGYYLLPNVTIFRVIGRLALPLFAFMIAEGAKYTKNRLKYIGLMAGVGAALQVVLFLLTRTMRLNILLTFTLSLCVIYTFDLFKISLFNKKSDIISKFLFLVLFVGTSFAVIFLTRALVGISFEYGFFGCLVPIFAAAPCLDKTEAPEWLKKLDNLYVRLGCMCIPLFVLCFTSGQNVQWFCFLALIPLALYSEKRGEKNLKYFFYIFYPAHLILLILINYLIYA